MAAQGSACSLGGVTISLQTCLQSKLYALSVLVGPHTALRVWTAYTMLIEHLGSEMSLSIQSFLHCIAGLFKTPPG